MSKSKRDTIKANFERTAELSIAALEAAANALADQYYQGIEKLKSEGVISGYVKLQFRARMRAKSLELAWVNKHINSGKPSYESITKPRGKPFYNMMVLRNQGLEGMEALIDDVEAQARILREGHRALIESMTKTDVFLRRLTELNPRIIGAINASQDQSQTTALTSPKAKQPVALNLDLELF